MNETKERKRKEFSVVSQQDSEYVEEIKFFESQNYNCCIKK